MATEHAKAMAHAKAAASVRVMLDTPVNHVPIVHWTISNRSEMRQNSCAADVMSHAKRKPDARVRVRKVVAFAKVDGPWKRNMDVSMSMSVPSAHTNAPSMSSASTTMAPSNASVMNHYFIRITPKLWKF